MTNNVRSAVQDIAPKGRTPRSAKGEKSAAGSAPVTNSRSTASTSKAGDVVKTDKDKGFVSTSAPAPGPGRGRQPEMFKGRPWREVAAENKQKLSDANSVVKAAERADKLAADNIVRANKALERAKKDFDATNVRVLKQMTKEGLKKPNESLKADLTAAKDSVKNAEAGVKAAQKARGETGKNLTRSRAAFDKTAAAVKKIEDQRSSTLN